MSKKRTKTRSKRASVSTVSADKALIRGIVADPDADKPRLAFAGWLKQHGDAANAQLIRVQCRLARMSEYERAYLPLVKQETTLVEQCEAQWGEVLRPLGVARPVFVRGLIESVSIEASAFLKHAKRLFEAVPWLRRIELLSAGKYLDRLSASAHLARLMGITFSQETPLRDAGAAALARWPRLPELRSLWLFQNEVSDAGAAGLAASPIVAHLQEFEIARNAIGVEGARSLAESEHQPPLIQLGADFNPLTDEGAVLLLRSPLARRLEILTVGATDIGDETLRTILKCPHLSLRELRASSNQIGQEGIGALAGAAHLSSLNVLNVGNNPVGDEGGSALVRSRHLKGLKLLDIAQTGVSDRTVKAIARSPHFARLRTLNLANNDAISSAGILALARSPHLAQLEELDISYTCVDDAGVQALMRSPRLPRLVSLNVEGLEWSEETQQEYEKFGKRFL